MIVLAALRQLVNIKWWKNNRRNKRLGEKVEMRNNAPYSHVPRFAWCQRDVYALNVEKANQAVIQIAEQ